MLFWGRQVMPFFDKKKDQKNYEAKLIFDRLQLFLVKPFFDQVPNKGSALENPCQPWTKMEESRLWGS